MEQSNFYRTIWRWHFYASLFVMPLAIVLALTGSAYLFKPQIDRWEERAYRGLSVEASVSPNAQMAAAMAAFPGSQFHSYRLPEHRGDAAMIHLALADGHAMRDVFVSPQGKVLGSFDPKQRIAPTLARIHGSLFAGRVGGWIVELAASWAIVMILTGLYLWWPRGRVLAGVVWPRLRRGKRIFWRDLHAVTGFWISGFVLVLLVSGMPWAGVWGDAFKIVRTQAGWVQGPQDWKIGTGEHAAHDHDAMMRQQASGIPMVALSDMVRRAQAEHMAFPVLVVPPGAPVGFGPPSDMAWTIRSEAQNRPLARSVEFDMATGREVARSGFADKHVLDRIVGYGIAWHEGQLFGWINQLAGVLTAAGLVTLVVSGFILWRRRRPTGVLGAPPAAEIAVRTRGAAVVLFLLALLLPMLAFSLLAMALFDRLLLPHLPGCRHWLGVARV